jgi:hypothetical protein
MLAAVGMTRADSIPSLGDGTGFQANGNAQSTLLGAPTISGGMATLTNPSSLGGGGTTGDGESSSIFYKTPLNITQFSASFTYSAFGPISAFGPADGLTFTVQNDPSGAFALGDGGAGLGYGGITKSVAVELNIWQFVSIGPGTAIGTNGLTGAGGGLDYTDVSANGINLFGTPVNVNVTYDGTTLTEKLTQGTNMYTGSATLNLASILGSSTGYVGFTASDGLGYATQTVSDFQFSSPAVVPLPAAAWSGMGLLGLLGLVRRRRARG